MTGGACVLYIKAEKSVIVDKRTVLLSDVAKVVCGDAAVLAQMKKVPIYTFQNDSVAAISVLKVIESIHKENPAVEVVNLGESDILVDYRQEKGKNRAVENAKTALLCILIFFGASFTIMAFNNDIGITDVFAKLYYQVVGRESTNVTELEICYSIGLSIGIAVFFNHIGRRKRETDPTPIQVEMRKYEADLDSTLLENIARKGKSIDVD